MRMKENKFNHGVGQNSYHLVWKPKYSWDCFKFPWVKKDCEAIINEAVLRYKLKLYELEVMPDHVHVFVEIPPTMSVSKALNLIKGYSSFKLFRKHPWLRNYFRKGHLWSPGKFFRSVGNVTAEGIKNYIAESNRNSRNQEFLTRYPAL
jgi:putative transposase